MSRETWDWDSGEDDGYNHLAAFETTLINFKLVKDDEACSMDECRKFSKKWSLFSASNAWKIIAELKSKIENLTQIIDEQSSEIYNLRRELSKEVDSINDDFRELRSDLSHDINVLEGNIDSVSNSLDDFGSEIADLKHDLDKVTNEVDDITKNLADKILLT